MVLGVTADKKCNWSLIDAVFVGGMWGEYLFVLLYLSIFNSSCVGLSLSKL